MQKKNVFQTMKFAAIIFAIMILYCFLHTFAMDSTGLYPLFLGDFSIGICTRLLVGSLLSIFKDSFTQEWIVSFLKISTMLVFLVTAHYTGSMLSQSEKEERKTLFVFVALFVLCPFSITVYAGDIFGFIDIFCMVVLLMTVYFGSNRVLVWSLPVLLSAGVFIHDCFITAYMAPCLGVIAYYVIKKYGKKLWASAVFIVSAIGCAATSIYSMFFANSTLKMTESEMLNYLAEKGNCSVDEVSGYLESFLFYKDPVGVADQEYSNNVGDIITVLFRYANQYTSTINIVLFCSVIPLVFLIFYIWIKAIRNSNGFMEKVPYILFMLTPVPQIVSLFLSSDFTRFLSTIVIVQMFYLFVCAKQKDESVLSALRHIGQNIFLFFVPCLCVLLENLHKGASTL